MDPEQIILFGSHARGNAKSDSDLDLLIVTNGSLGREWSRRKITGQIRKALWSVLVPIDLLVFSPQEIERWRNSINHVIAQALRDGKVLYVRP